MAAWDYHYIAELVIRAQANDSDAFAELYAATYQRQYHFSCRYLKDECLAQDALQETYTIALESISKLREPSLVIAWLNQINFRVCYNLSTKQQRYNTELKEYNDALLAEIGPPYMQNGKTDPEALAIQGDFSQYLIDQVLKLPFTESQVILLKYYQHMKQDEIARLMDISRSSVKRYLASGLKRLQQVLQKGGASA